MNKRQPFNFADDYVPASVDNDPIPLITPFQKYMLEGMRGISADVQELKTSVDALAPRVAGLEQRAALWNKALTVGKYLAPAVILQLFPSLAKYVPIITEAISKANP